MGTGNHRATIRSRDLIMQWTRARNDQFLCNQPAKYGAVSAQGGQGREACLSGVLDPRDVSPPIRVVLHRLCSSPSLLQRPLMRLQGLQNPLVPAPRPSLLCPRGLYARAATAAAARAVACRRAGAVRRARAVACRRGSWELLRGLAPPTLTPSPAPAPTPLIWAAAVSPGVAAGLVPPTLASSPAPAPAPAPAPLIWTAAPPHTPAPRTAPRHGWLKTSALIAHQQGASGSSEPARSLPCDFWTPLKDRRKILQKAPITTTLWGE